MSNLLTNSKIMRVISGVAGVLALALVLGGVVVAPSSAQALTQAEATAIITALGLTGSQAAVIQALVTGGSSSGSTGGTGHVFATTLKQGSTGNEVKELQKALNSLSCCMVAASGAGSPGNETTYFGPATKAAVVKFQNAYASDILTPLGLTSGIGLFGPASITKMNALMAGGGTGTTNPPPATGGALSVSAGVQPMNGYILEGAARTPFTKFVITAGAADVQVTGVNVMRVGPGVDAIFAGVVLLDEQGQQIGIAKTLGSLHTAVVGEPFTVRAGTSRTLTVAGNAAASLDSYVGQSVALAVTGVQTSNGASVSGVSEAAPITGAYHTTNMNLAIGSLALAVDSLDPDSAVSKEIGTTNYTFAAVRASANSAEDIRLDSVRWNQTGSVGASDLANLMTYVDGTAYPVTISSDGKYYTSVFPGGLTIAKGLQKTISIKGDIVGGSNRTVQFDLYRATDIYATGLTYGAGITSTQSENGTASTASEFTAGTPFFSGSVITVTGGSATTINKATSGDGAAQNIAVNVSNVPLGGFSTDIKGEPISVQQTVFWFTVTGSGGSITDIDNVSLYNSSGAIVAGPQDVGSTGKVTFTDTITLPVGPTTYYLKGKLGTSFTNNQTIVASTTPSSDWTSVTGQTTGNTITLSNGLVTMNTMTVRAATTTVSVSSDPSAQNVVMGVTGFTFANIQYDASASGEDVRFNSAQYRIFVDTGSSYPTNCFAYDGSTRLNSSAVNPTSAGAQTFTFDTPLVVTKGTVKTVALKCDIPTNLTLNNTIKWGTATSSALTGTGVTSGSSFTASFANSGNGGIAGQMTLKTGGSLTVTLDASTPGYTQKVAGTSGNIAAVLKIHATNEALNLTQLGLQLSNTSASSSPADLVSVSLWDGSTQVGTAVFSGTNRYATTTLSTPLAIPKDGDKQLTVKVDLAMIGTSLPGTEGAMIQVDYDGNADSGNSTTTKAVGASSGGTVQTSSTSDTSSAGFRYFRSVPTLAIDALPTSGVGDGRLLRFKVTADSHGDIGIGKLSFATSSSNITGITNINLFGFTDSSYSQPISGVGSGGQIMNSNVAATANGNFNIYPQTTAGASTTIQVPAGATRYFELRGTVAGVISGSSVSVTLKGDTGYTSMSTLMGSLSGAAPTAIDYTGATNANFLWSPNATTTATSADNDWTNGYGVAGLPSSGLIQSRSN